MDIEQLEAFALAVNRTEALEQLIPGTEDYYYLRCLDHQHRGELDRVRELLPTWAERCGKTARYLEIENRLMLLSYEETPERALEELADKLSIHFDHQRQVEGKRTDHPTHIDPASADRAAFDADARSRHTGLEGHTDEAFRWLLDEASPLDAHRSRQLLTRLSRPDYPGLETLVLQDLEEKTSSGFGSLAIHHQLTRAQLNELASRSPRLKTEAAFVDIYLTKLHPSPDVDWKSDPLARRAHLDRLWGYVEHLGPAFHALESTVLYHRLEHDRREGIYDRERFLRYLALPRHASYVAPSYLERREHRGRVVTLGQSFQRQTLLAPVSDDEPLVRDYLTHFFAGDEGYEQLAVYVREDYLRAAFAETKLLAGSGDAERWYSMLDDPARYQALRERVDIEFAAENRTRFGADDPVELVVDIKNVPSLVVRVFEINTLNYFLTAGREVDTSVDLDGLVASEEHTHVYDEPPVRRVRRRFSFESLSRPGVYVVELIGNGRSSRALIQRGGLRFLERVGAAGHVLTILDESGEALTDASVWLEGREYPPRDDGTVLIPFTTRPGQTSLLLRRGEVTTLESFVHRAETYRFAAAIWVDREQLLSKAKARVVIRPSLTIDGAPVSPALLEDLTLTIESTDRDGTASRIEAPVELTPGEEAVHELSVPEALRTITFSVRARVRSVSEQRHIDVSDRRVVTLNQIDLTEVIEWPHLSLSSEGYALDLLGKSGEPRADVPLALELGHGDFTFMRRITVQTDGSGRVHLGALDEITRIDAHLPSGRVARWSLPVAWCRAASVVHACEGSEIQIPTALRAGERGRGVSLLEKIGQSYVADHQGRVTLEDGRLRIVGLAAGDYQLRLLDESRRIDIRVTRGRMQGSWAVSRARLLECRDPRPLSITSVTADESSITIAVANAREHARVHVVGTRFISEASPIVLDRGRRAGPQSVRVHGLRSHYVSGRDIGDEYRYVLERRLATRLPGNMLARPELLLNPWAVRSTSTGLEEAAAGGAYGASEARARRRGASAKPQVQGRPPAPGGQANLDFLPATSRLETNLSPDPDGTIRLDRAAFGAATLIQVIAVDGDHTAMALLTLPPIDATPKDLRQEDGLEPTAHFLERKQRTVLAAGTELAIDDITTAKVETFDTLRDVFGLLSTISQDATLREFEFTMRWPELSQDEKRDKYSEHACHELSLFLSFKDRPFFEEVVQPYLESKQDKTFIDDYLLDRDLERYRASWTYGRLNVLERILLARRIGAERGPGSRHVADLFDLVPPDVELDNRFFRAALQGSALDTGDTLGIGAARERAIGAMKKAKGGPPGSGGGPMGGGGLPPGAPPSPRAMAPPPPMSAAAPAAMSADAPMPLEAGYAADAESDGGDFFANDMAARDEVRRFFRKLDKTQEWAENNYYHRRISEQGPELIEVNPFWRDFAAHDGTAAFRSANFAYASGGFAEMMCALAVLDLPFTAEAHDVAYQGASMRLGAGSDVVVFHEEIKPGELGGEGVPILVSQSYFRADDRYRYEGNERHDKYVTGELLTHVAYQCQVVLTNPTSSPHKLDLLLQIPEGSLPLHDGFRTRGMHVHLPPHGTQSIEYAFYFAEEGTYGHFPVHVSKNEALIAFAESAPLSVVRRPSEVDGESWAYVSQQGEPEQVLTFLEEENLGRVDLSQIAWRMRDRAFYDRAIAVLSQRHAYQHVLWAYSLHHDDTRNVAEYLRHCDGFLRSTGLALRSKLLRIDPVERGWHELLEYSPLVNARAHRLGGKLTILNDALASQYRRFLSVLSCQPGTSDADRLTATYYLLLMDRVETGLDMFERVDGERVEARLQYDYVHAYVSLYRGDPALARDIAARHGTHPVDRWRKRFENVLAVIDETDGGGAAVVDEEDRDQEQARLATTEPAFDFEVDQRALTISYQNLTACVVNFYLMDVELLFSRQPFMQEAGERFSIIRPQRSQELDLPEGRSEISVDLPPDVRGANTVIEVVGGGVRRTEANYAHELLIQLTHQYGQLRVRQRGARRPLPGTYVKVYARRLDGETSFYKDGYTDLRGAFDYASLSTDELDQVARFAILVLSEEHGAVIREAPPPKR